MLQEKGRPLFTKGRQIQMTMLFELLQKHQCSPGYSMVLSNFLIPKSFRCWNDEVRIWGITMTSRYFHRTGTIPMNSQEEKRQKDIIKMALKICMNADPKAKYILLLIQKQLDFAHCKWNCLLSSQRTCQATSKVKERDKIWLWVKRLKTGQQSRNVANHSIQLTPDTKKHVPTHCSFLRFFGTRIVQNN